MTGSELRVVRRLVCVVTRLLTAVTVSSAVSGAHCLTSRGGGAGVMRKWVPAKELKLKRALKYLSVTYVLLLAASYVAMTLLGILQGAESTEVGCYSRTTLISGAHCKGFTGAEALEFILNLPVLLFYAPLFGVSGLIEGPLVLRPLLVLGLGLLLWSPITYFLWQVRYGKFVPAAIALTLIGWPLVQTGTIL